MILQYNAHSCFTLTYADGTTLVTDPYDESLTYPLCADICDAALVTHDHFDHNHTQSLSGTFETICAAGTYHIGDLTITATDSFHDDREGALRGKNLLMRIDGEDLSIAHLGDLGHSLSDAQRAALRGLDVLLLPIGGFFTIDTLQAEAIIRELNPRVAVAMHFRTDAIADWKISTEEQFVRDLHAARMPRKIEITRENIDTLPRAIVLEHI